MHTYEGQLDPPTGRFALVAARFNLVVTHKLVQAAHTRLLELGVTEDDIDLVWVPGSFEIPAVAQGLAESGFHCAIVCLGCVVRGDTDHYQYVAGEAARGVAEAGRTTGVPVLFGILTTETVEQALQRAGPRGNSVGASAAEAAVRMANLFARLPAHP